MRMAYRWPLASAAAAVAAAAEATEPLASHEVVPEVRDHSPRPLSTTVRRAIVLEVL